MESIKHRIQINAVVTDRKNARVEVITQRGRRAKTLERFYAVVQDTDDIEVGEEHEIPLRMRILIHKVIRAALDD